MKLFKKAASILLVSTMVLGATACTPKEEATSEAPATSEATTEVTDAEEAASDEVLYIYNSKGENAAQFTEMCKAYTAETGVAVKDFSIGSGQDHMETLRAEMNTNTPPTIFSIQGLKELAEWEEGGFVTDLTTVADPEFKTLHDGIPQNFRLSADGAASYGVPYNVEGYGYIVDKQMLTDLFGAESVEPILTDLRAATYEEFEQFCLAVEAYIATPSAATTVLNGNTYTFLPEKTGVAANLNGVFAVMGAEKWTYGDHFVNVALNAQFATAAEAYNADDATLDSMTNVFTTYAKALDFKTSHLAGAAGPAVRGNDFVSSANFGYDQTVQIFADSKALFFKQGNWAFGNIEKVKPEMASRLDFIPVKMPIKQEDIKVEGLTVEKFNSSIPVFVPNFYAVNAKASDAQKQMAYDFLVWLNTSETGKKFITEEFDFIPYNVDPATTTIENSLGNSIIGYMKDGNTLAAPYHGAPPTWSGDTFGLKIMEEYMTKETWTEQDYADISKYAIDSWKELKAN